MVKVFEKCACVAFAIIIILFIYTIYMVHNPPLYITKKFSHCHGSVSSPGVCSITGERGEIYIKGEKGDKGDKGDNDIDNCFQPLVVSHLALTESVMYRHN